MKLLFLILLIGISYIGITQPVPLNKNPLLLTEEENETDTRNHGCQKINKYTLKQRLTFFPFKKAKEIQLLSFDMPDSVIFGGKIPIKNGVLDNARVMENITLSEVQIDSLTHILYNHVYLGPFFTIYKIECYNPRNAILFNDAKGKTFAYIELCFECTGNRLSSPKVKPGDFCDEKYELLRIFFRQTGIQFGTQERVYEEEE